MSYQAGIGPGLLTNRQPIDPRVICDGCGAERVLKGGFPPKWFMNRKPPPGWRGLRMASGRRRWDLCPGCWKSEEVNS